ncbi:acyl-CoA dehydrogenase [Caulobacter sp. 17J80-11]|uniref:acyl-CoA dehydrogenase n=1 Tax=Caulobacter sp. 17J80-11 TaxID=2763502 RepID=UPI00165388A5|nr:acyl-CoA dehydrogenase [Caulobacter sp. 17J80-11]MBC6983289.1 acyl-CoA dehydrogenase [Caulobacter sp. 17J80-11]
MTFRAPTRDLLFALTEVVGIDRLTAAFPDCDRDVAVAVLEAAGDLAEGVLAPLNRAGDLHGARFEDGRVRAAPGFADAYRAFAQGGWTGLAADPEHGGQGLPKTLELAVYELMHAANTAFTLCPTLTQGAVEALHAHGDARQKALYLPKLVSGEWTGVMDLTEPQAGSDLGAVRTRAEPDGSGGYRLYGQKIFITWGDHDCADNIVHLVLARLPDAPEGVKGISLFLTAKRLVGEDGALGEANALGPVGIEHKLGIHASPTCVIQFEGARAELVGEAGKGLAQMFTMMNSARLNIGVQGVGVAERAYQQALAYALERRQGRSVWTGEASARIFDHPDVRRTLLLMKAKTEAARAICLTTALAGDLGRTGALREAVLTPVAKAWSTDVGVEVASRGLQVHGGMGFIEETGAAQHYRDARIAPIYEGTNGIQALDLVGRKLALGDGEGVRALLAEIDFAVAELQGVDALALVAARLQAGVAAARMTSEWLLQRRGEADALAGASGYLNLLGDVVGGWMLAKGALAAARRAETDADPYWRTKIVLARLFAEEVLTGAHARAAAVVHGAADLEAVGPEGLAA